MVPTWFWCLTAFLFGISVGSFLNVVIYRLPIGGSLIYPKHSYCPHCKNELTARDLVPLVSFLALGGKCRNPKCRKPISWRYFNVELLTGLLFVAVVLHYPHSAVNAIPLILFIAVLIPIFFIDLATFTIPLSLNLFAFAIAIVRDGIGIAMQEPGHELLFGWLPRCVLGAVIGILIFGVVRLSGWFWLRAKQAESTEAMGIGDVYLARAMGAMLISYTPAEFNPLRLFVAWVMLSCFSGLVVGPALIFLRNRKSAQLAASNGASITEEEEPPLPPDPNDTLGNQLLDIGYVLWLQDLFEYVILTIEARSGKPQPQVSMEEEAWGDEAPAPSAIPFGPFLAIGFLATVFFGEPLTAWYLAWALPKQRI